MPPSPSSDEHRARLVDDTLVVLGLIAAFVAAGLLVWSASQILLLAFAGILLAAFLNAPADLLARRTPLPYGWGLALTVALLLSLTVAVTLFAGAPIRDGIDELLRSLPDSMAQVRARVREWPGGEMLLDRFASDNAPTPLTTHLVSRITGTAGMMWDVLAKLAYVIFMGLFLALSPRRYRDGVVLLFPPSRRDRAREVMNALGRTLRAWLLGQLVAMLLVGGLVYLGLWAIGLPLAFVLALFAGVLEFVPILGPVVAFIPVALIALAEGTRILLYATLIYVGVQQVESNLIVPLVQRRTVDLPPALTLTAVFVSAAAFGLLGMMVATPLAAVALVLVKMLYLDDVR